MNYNEKDTIPSVSKQLAFFENRLDSMMSNPGSLVEEANKCGFDVDEIYRKVLMSSSEKNNVNRNDSVSTAMLANQLIYLRAKISEVVYPEIKYNSLLDINEEIPVGADRMRIQKWDYTGEFKEYANNGDDIPVIDVSADYDDVYIYNFAASFLISMLDLDRAAFAGEPLNSRKQEATRLVWERQIDEMAILGWNLNSTTKRLRGIANIESANSVTTDAAGTWESGAKTGEQILADVMKLDNSISEETNQIHRANMLILPPAAYRYIVTKPYAASYNPGFTIAEMINKTMPNLKIDESIYLPGAASDGTSNRIVMYKKDPSITYLLKRKLEMLPAQLRQLSYETILRTSCGGVVSEQPKTISYMDGV